MDTKALDAAIAKAQSRVAAGEIDLRDVGKILFGIFDQDLPAAMLVAARIGAKVVPPLPDAALDEIEARANAATPAPWEADKYFLYIWGRDSAMVADSRLDEAHLEVKHDPIIRARGVGGKLPIDENMRFIAHARTDIPILAAEVRRLRAELSSARAEIDALTKAAYEVRADTVRSTPLGPDRKL